MQRLGKPEPRMQKPQVDAIMAQARVGDILLSHEDLRLTSSFIRGYYDHAAIIGPNSTVIEAIGKGVQQVDLAQWLYQKDDVALIKVDCSDEVALIAGGNAIQYVGRMYDYLFRLAADRIYCSELVWLCYNPLVASFMPGVTHDSEILPDDYWDRAVAKQGFTLVYDSHPEAA